MSSQNSNDIGSLWAHYKSRIWGSPEKWVPNCLLQKKMLPPPSEKKNIQIWRLVFLWRQSPNSRFFWVTYLPLLLGCNRFLLQTVGNRASFFLFVLVPSQYRLCGCGHFLHQSFYGNHTPHTPSFTDTGTKNLPSILSGRSGCTSELYEAEAIQVQAVPPIFIFSPMKCLEWRKESNKTWDTKWWKKITLRRPRVAKLHTHTVYPCNCRKRVRL